MPIYAPAESTYELAPAGLHPAVCCDVVDEGYKPTQFGEKHKVRFVFQIAEQTSKGRRFTVSAWFNLSMHENASMRQFLEQWRGRPFTDQEINQPPYFDLESVIGVPCVINVVHNQANGKTYANIAAVAAHSPRMGPPLEVEDYTRVQDREEQGQPAAAFAAQRPRTQPAAQSFYGVQAQPDEIPF
jgi:hypothetical protein